MANITVLEDEIFEGTTPEITANLQDENGDAVAGSNLTTLTLTLFSRNDLSYPIINTREDQNVLNVNDVTVDEAGLVTWSTQPEDTIVYDSNLKLEKHRAVFEWTYDSGAKNGKHIIDMTIKNLAKTVT